MKKTTLSILHAATALGLTAGAAQADFFVGNVYIDGSLCVGNDCVNGEAFGFDTIKLKENNLRIKFDDTSTAAGFPNGDWELRANDSSSGGTNKFGIVDVTGSRSVFTVEAGAPNNALYVEDSGDLGLGTANPALEIHVVDGDTPSLRLQQDGSSGFAPQIFDVAGNEANFFIRDATNGSTLPFRLEPGAPSNAIYIDSSGDIGLGTTSPGNSLHIREATGNAAILLDPDEATQAIRISANASSDELRVAFDGLGTRLSLDSDGNMEITGTLITTGGGGACTVGDPCDAVFDPAVYTVPSIEDHAAQMWQNKYLPAVGPTGPDTPIDMTEKLLRMLNELEHAHIYIDELHGRLKQQETANLDLMTRIEALEKAITD